MAKEDTTGVETQQGQPNVETATIIVNNKEVIVPKELATDAEKILNENFNELKSGLEKKYMSEKQQVEQERKTLQENFKKDSENYNRLLAQGITDLSKYSPLTLGGDGSYYGDDDGSVDIVDAVTQPKTQKNSRAFEETKLTELQKRLDRIEEKERALDLQSAQYAVNIASNLKKEFPGSDAYFDAIKAVDMKIFHESNGRAPNETEIRSMFKKRQGYIAVHKEEPSAVIPDIRGGGRNIPPKKGEVPHVSDINGVIKYVMGKT